MGLSATIGNAFAGLKASQAAVDLVARNIASAETPGYTRKLHNQSTVILGDSSTVVSETATRQLDTVLQRQLRAERAASGYADTLATYHGRIDTLFGEPGGENALDTRVNALQETFQALTTSPDNFAARAIAVGEAGGLASHLNGLSADVQQLRQEAERGIAEAVSDANTLLNTIASLNTQVVAGKAGGNLNPDILDQRDRALDELARLVDISVVEDGSGLISVSTRTGTFLVADRASTLEFDERTTVNAGTLYDPEPLRRGVGTITVYPGGIDLIRDGTLRSGEIAALINMRDEVLVEAQTQLDEIASGLSLAMSTEDRLAARPPATTDTLALEGIADLQRGDTLTFKVKAGAGIDTLRIVNASAAATVTNGATPDPNDVVVGVDLDQGMPAVAAALQAVLNTRYGAGAPTATVSPTGVLTVVSAGTAEVTALSARVSADALQGDGLALPLFRDGKQLYTGSLEGGRQQTGYAGRIAVNADLVADSAPLTRKTATTPLGDASRAEFLADRLGKAQFTFAPETGVGTKSVPFTGSVSGFARAVVTQRGVEAAAAEKIKEGQDIVTRGLEQRQTETSGVNIDMELADLIELQNAYSANARVMQVAQELIDILLRS